MPDGHHIKRIQILLKNRRCAKVPEEIFRDSLQRPSCKGPCGLSRGHRDAAGIAGVIRLVANDPRLKEARDARLNVVGGGERSRRGLVLVDDVLQRGRVV